MKFRRDTIRKTDLSNIPFLLKNNQITKKPAILRIALLIFSCKELYQNKSTLSDRQLSTLQKYLILLSSKYRCINKRGVE
jgi:hypothetical protein